MSVKGKTSGESKREVPPFVVIAGIVVLVLAVGAGGYYAFNGGWKTASQQDDVYKHEIMPIMAAKHGDKEAFEAENKLRKEHGQAPLEMPKDRQQTLDKNRQKLADLQKLLGAKQGNPTGPQ